MRQRSSDATLCGQCLPTLREAMPWSGSERHTQLSPAYYRCVCECVLPVARTRCGSGLVTRACIVTGPNASARLGSSGPRRASFVARSSIAFSSDPFSKRAALGFSLGATLAPLRRRATKAHTPLSTLSFSLHPIL